MKQETHFYVTTPIYYVTDRPHLGTLYSTLIADVIARYNKLQGKEVFFLTGTDEHGQKIAQAAQKAGKEPQEFVDKFIPIYKDIWKKYHIHYSHFIRTTDHEHVQAVQAWLQKLIDKGDIYKARYEGWYCTPCETYLTEKEAAIKQNEEAPRCPTCNRLTHFVSEESYFFKLSAYQDKLLEFYKKNPDFIVPKERFAEVLSFVQSGLKDLSISRSTITWGIPFPHDSKHVTYVWADALNNYITGVGYAQKGHEKKFATWWPADVHVLGKDIIRFHAVYWPAFLMASGLELPKKLLVHGWIKINDQKMTKSTGNVVDPEVLYEQFGNDTVRYYLMRYIAVTQDSSFYYEELEKAISSDLANDLGNLLNRAVTLATRNNLVEIQPRTNWSPKAQTLRDQGYAMIKAYTNYMDNYLFHMALAEVWKFIHQVNAYFHEAEPWKLIKEDKNAFQEVIAAVCNSLYIIASVLWPVMPEKIEELCTSLGSSVAPHLGQNLFTDCAFNPWDRSFKLVAIDPLFKKPDVVKGEEKKEPVAPIAQETISFDEFAKVQLVVGTIEQCEIIPKSDKLYKMQVNFGPLGMRQILAGVRNYFKPEELIHKQTIFVVNLQPRTILGLESQGMMLVAPDSDGTSKMTTVAQSVPNGTRLR